MKSSPSGGQSSVEEAASSNVGAAPLAGIKVIEIAQNLSGPFAAQILAHLGAEVVKVEREQGDDARGWGPPFHRGASPAFISMNSNKMSVSLDLKDRGKVAQLLELCDEADILVQNLRPGALEDLGLGADEVRARNPRLIYCSLWGFGRKGPLRLRPCYEPIMQAFAGLMMQTGDEGGPPTRIGASVLDLGTGMWLAIGALAALAERERTGKGCVVDASLFETALGFLAEHITVCGATGAPPKRHRTGNSRVSVFRSFDTKTEPIIIAAGNNRLFAKLAHVLGHAEWETDPRFCGNAQRLTHEGDLIPLIEAILLTRPRSVWLELLEAAGVPCSPVQGVDEMLEHPHTKESGMLQRVPELGLDVAGLPISFNGVRPTIRRPPPALGQHTLEVFDGHRRKR